MISRFQSLKLNLATRLFGTLLVVCALSAKSLASGSMIITAYDSSDEVITAERELWKDFEHGDSQAMIRMLDEDFTAFSGSLPGRMESRDAERAHLLGFLDGLKGRLVEYKMISPRVQRFGDTAILTYLFSTTVSVAGVAQTRQGKQTSVWVKTTAGWKQVHYHYDYSPP